MSQPSSIAAPGVYVAQLVDGLVKIGSTGDLGRRWPQLRQYGAVELLAWLPAPDRNAAYRVERFLHEAFAAERQGRVERFRYSYRLAGAILTCPPPRTFTDWLEASNGYRARIDARERLILDSISRVTAPAEATS
jgi:hypothetical protein